MIFAASKLQFFVKMRTLTFPYVIWEPKMRVSTFRYVVYNVRDNEMLKNSVFGM